MSELDREKLLNGAFESVMGADDMPPDDSPAYDRWLFDASVRALEAAGVRLVPVEAWSQDISGAIWAEIRSGLTGRFEEQFILHQQADRYEKSSAHLDECARILTRRIEDKLWPTAPETKP